MSTIKKIIPCLFILLFFFSISNLAYSAPLEVSNDGKVNINTVLHLEPQSTPPANPSRGDIYFSTDNRLLIYTTEWIPIFKPMFLGVETRTHVYTSSGTWVVPATIKNINVTLVAGGKTGQPGTSNYGGAGGASGQVKTRALVVSEGQNITITIGNQNQNSYFASLLTAYTNSGTPGSPGTAGTSIPYGGSMPGNGGAGANGYGSVALAANGQGYPIVINGVTFQAGGTGGIGYGAGGGGGSGVNRQGGSGAPGYCLITYQVNKYENPDGSIYYSQD